MVRRDAPRLKIQICGGTKAFADRPKSTSKPAINTNNPHWLNLGVKYTSSGYILPLDTR